MKNLILHFKEGSVVECQQTGYDNMDELLELFNNEGTVNLSTTEGEIVINLDNINYIRILE